MGGRISELREAQGISQMQLASACGVSQQAISKIEVERCKPSLSLAIALARALGCTIDDLFREEQGRTG